MYAGTERRGHEKQRNGACCSWSIFSLHGGRIGVHQYLSGLPDLLQLYAERSDSWSISGDYSRNEIKEAARTIDAGESSPLSEEILSLLPDQEKPESAPAQVTSEQIRELTPTMTREEVLSFLGDTQDLGSGIYIYVYEVDRQYLLRIPFADDEAQLGVTGEDLLKALIPIT